MESAKWMKTVLKAAGIYNVLWGVWVVLFPSHFFELVGMEPVNHEVIWQGMGMVIGVYGLGYWWAADDPLKHWPIVAVGLLGKLFGPIGFCINYFSGKIPFEFAYTMFTNDFIWWVPFSVILIRAHKTQKIKWL